MTARRFPPPWSVEESETLDAAHNPTTGGFSRPEPQGGAMLSRYLIGTCTILFLTLVNMPVLAKDHSAVRMACGKEINSQCRGVPDTRGQLLACLYRHQTSLSPKCEGTVWGSISRLGKVLAKDQNVLRACDADALQWCKETVAGGGNLVSCFLIAQQMMSPQCKAAVFSVWDKRRWGG